MNDPFKSENYKKNLDSLIEAIKLKNIGEQYNKTVRDLSQTLESFTDKAEDVANTNSHYTANRWTTMEEKP
ncbi:hypothetical protein [Wolbachia endosymbiont of Dactylopius coccus]|nr:MAG: hypothetical protein TV42_06005 [Wolbachia endosymbiont of Dactylopius coccus]